MIFFMASHTPIKAIPFPYSLRNYENAFLKSQKLNVKSNFSMLKEPQSGNVVGDRLVVTLQKKTYLPDQRFGISILNEMKQISKYTYIRK